MTERAEKQTTDRSKEDLHKQVVRDLDKASSDPDPPEVLRKLTEAEEMLTRLEWINLFKIHLNFQLAVHLRPGDPANHERFSD